MHLFHPHLESFQTLDPQARELMRKSIAFFENKGLAKIKADDRERVWYADILEFFKQEQIFANLLTPEPYGEKGACWDTNRICAFNEILGFYSTSYWYTWQVSILGLGPIWMSSNEKVKRQTAKFLKAGGIFAFGVSEKEHGADLYASEMALSPDTQGHFLANGRKYYIGNGNQAAYVSTFGKRTDQNDYVFFVAETSRPEYLCHKNLINSQNFIAEFELKNYPVKAEEILSSGDEAWNTVLNSINIGKFNLGFAAIGMCTHAFYEAINHASHRRLFDHCVTDFVHIRQLMMDAYCRLVAMKAFSTRSIDYFRNASAEDRRYLLYNPMVKMKVTTQGEEVMNLLWDVIAAKGFEKETFFEMAVRDIRGLPKLEGTVHVNMALIIKFMKNYFFNPQAYPEIKPVTSPRNDDFLFQQGSTKGLSKIRFHDYRQTYARKDLANLRIFRKQINRFRQWLVLAPPTPEQIKDIDFLLIVGELFTLVVYGQLILENSLGLEDDLLDQIFDFMIRDFSKFALQLYSKTSSTKRQQWLSLRMIAKPTVNPERFEKIWKNQVFALKDSYTMQGA
ncbi:acyl-CoA dehydrogenase [bacterium (Candidatus Blackallbacteria) CG17_big_fil_post_rev_8_21_14_2_50_48_46]|uniref:Acyl-CoA dehydrogenase n=1 Tax=bacterium (Candidatus Blackallbacteria) CG17_big_fil_post_rev_8_21_14_2_50_48_46 TaxID=2014261 RepID=A0A2M7G815_9BACT|nr:MAG: acyl-CoA dehydrogenase [bacterium (Candidatus Blackallbacteria) CG18_big_fil_WC_8_21_14_2_50_49_26]PIW18235.1 MAG: acyl-CoA dehydrogenase [bacterium (Candidatus Blackallbacteria) CG17_big_fil_post_rev_8_21_14_2_50_48_46]PIW50666.1 MAG: acyl-CoA dehydrogenase [bacterium (Candidatus Blackallbacteria) CG13_big_fil_rev_8_21_14_2_50_49_14]